MGVNAKTETIHGLAGSVSLNSGKLGMNGRKGWFECNFCSEAQELSEWGTDG